MNILTKLRKGSRAKTPSFAGSARKTVEIFTNDDGSFALIFGANWDTMATSGGHDAAVAHAKSAKSSHYIFRSAQQQVGHCKIDANTLGDAQAAPAAHLAAKKYIGDSLFCLELQDGKYWVARTRSGNPTSTDEIFEGSVDEALEYVRGMIANDFEDISFHTNIHDTGISNVKSFSVEDLFDIPRTPHDLLFALPIKKVKVPTPVLVIVGLGLALVGGQWAWDQYKSKLLSDQRAIEKAAAVDPAIAWAPVLAEFERGLVEPSTNGVIQVRNSFDRLPVLWFGWTLNGARCQAQPPLGSKRQWSCQASYDRGEVGLTNSVMLTKVDQIWKPVFPKVNGMQVTWAVSQDIKPTKVASMQNKSDVFLAVSSGLQPLQAAIDGRPDISFVPVDMKPPVDEKGKAYPKPANFPAVLKAPVVIKGPLRSIDKLQQEMALVDWTAFGIAFNFRASPNEKGLRSSSMSAELTGISYAK